MTNQCIIFFKMDIKAFHAIIYLYFANSATLCAFKVYIVIMRPISPDVVNNIIALLDQGLSTRKIMKICKVGTGTIQKYRKIHCPDAEIKKGGRPKKLTAQDKRFCVRTLRLEKAKTATEVTKKLKENFGVSTSVKTVTLALNEVGMASGEKKTNPLLS